MTDSAPDTAALTAVEALGECDVALHVAEAIVHDLGLIGWEVRRQPWPAATDVPWALYEAMKRRLDQALHLIESFDPTSGTARARVFADDLRHVLEGTGGDRSGNDFCRAAAQCVLLRVVRQRHRDR